ncbi:MAG: ABC transporter permease [Bacteroidetes bacterium]|nr:ABC transporter permease [Bacteroidota bacterium]
MKFILYIAGRYLIAKKSHNVINVITLISIVGIVVSTAGLIIVLSVFNGVGNLVISLYDTFDPDMRITPSTGKYFTVTKDELANIKRNPNIRLVYEVIEDNALVRYGDKQSIARVRGIDSLYEHHTAMHQKIIDGNFSLSKHNYQEAVLGAGIAYSLSLHLKGLNNTLVLYYPSSQNMSDALNPDAFVQQVVVPSGVFALQQDFDSRYIFISLDAARQLYNKENEITALEFMLIDKTAADDTRKQLQSINKNWVIKTRPELHDFLYKIITTEKIAAYLILILILVISTFSIIGALTMLVIEKQKDITVLHSMGAGIAQLKKIFFTEGLLITLSGAVGGIFIGLIICSLQLYFGIIKMGSEEEMFVVDAYPVAMQRSDFIVTFMLVTFIGTLASLYVALKLINRNMIKVHLLNTANG